MTKILLLHITLLSGFLFSQKIHVRYTYVRSPIATLNEDLYIDENKVISRQDSIIQFKNLASSEGNIVAFKKGANNKAFYCISNNNNNDRKDFFFTSYVKDPSTDNYFIHDQVSKPIWTIDEKSTKKIAGYNCIKATSNFRGSDVTAYFTRELPYSVGPFKFFGLPGLILDIRVDNKSYDIWRAEKVEVDYKEKVNFNPNFEEFSKIEMKKFVELKDQNLAKSRVQDLKDLPSHVKVDYQINRFGIEKIFEWEKETENK